MYQKVQILTYSRFQKYDLPYPVPVVSKTQLKKLF
jgi:hypothetical protein